MTLTRFSHGRESLPYSEKQIRWRNCNGTGESWGGMVSQHFGNSLSGIRPILNLPTDGNFQNWAPNCSLKDSTERNGHE
ncbi:unnamed protein product [Allacma fusca]|uniref:Uncharacterized protein n=1 Tax=Allacma fusca TaxID=39272 RepID=A0A8J2KYT7_9HEXA|nr:unnamed protein product [Allacma fusca]